MCMQQKENFSEQRKTKLSEDYTAIYIIEKFGNYLIEKYLRRETLKYCLTSKISLNNL